MDTYALFGWLGNGCFFVRFLVQWIASERAGHSASPAVFWRISLLGYLCLGLYTWDREEYVLVAGCLVNAAIALRNLRFDAGGRLPGRAAAVIAGLALVLSLVAAVAVLPEGRALVWTACVVAGQALFGARFVVQWWASERRGVSHFPTAFWWLSLTGNALLLAYALHRRDVVLIAGYSAGPFVQVRNLVLVRRARARALAA